MNIENKDWLKVEQFFIKLFLQEGYNQELSERLGFYVCQNLQNASPLIKLAEAFLQNNNSKFVDFNLEEIMIQIHILLSNYDNLEMAHKILKSYEA